MNKKDYVLVAANARVFEARKLQLTDAEYKTLYDAIPTMQELCNEVTSDGGYAELSIHPLTEENSVLVENAETGYIDADDPEDREVEYYNLILGN